MSRVSPQDHEPVDPPKRAKLTPPQRARLLLAYKGRCARCQQKIMDGEWEANHTTPLFQLREGDPQEFEPVHKTCHRELTDGQHAKDNAKLRRLIAKQKPREEWPATQKIRSQGFRKRQWGQP